MAVKASNQVSLVDITDAYSVMLTSEAFTFVGDTSGAPSGLSCTTQAVAYRGSTQCSEVIIGTIVCPTEIAARIFNNGTKSPVIIFKTTATITDACEAIIPVVVDGITINKKFSFAVAMKGDAGNLDDLNVTEKLNSELKIEGNSIALTTGHFTIDAANMKLDENGNAEFTGDVKAESFEFKDSLKMGFGQWGSSITLFDFSDPMHVDASQDTYNVVIPNFTGTHIDNGTTFRNYIEGLEVRVPTSITNGLTVTNSLNATGKNGQLYVNDGVEVLKGYFNVKKDGIYIFDKKAIDGYDDWLRLNNNKAFSSGVYTPGAFVSDTSISAPILYARANSTRQAILVGDDCWLGDVDQANTLSIMGNQNNNEGYLYMGSGGKFGFNGSYFTASHDIYVAGGKVIRSAYNNVWNILFEANGGNPFIHFGTTSGNYGIYCWSSDTKLKENIKPTNKTALDKVNGIEFIQFDWKSNGVHVDLGVSANQLEEFIPDAVYDIEQGEDAEYDTLKNIDTGKMTTYALKAIQELSAIVDEQSEIISKLESRIRDLEDKLKMIS